MRTANPALNERAYFGESRSMSRGDVMTINGAVAKTGLLTALLVAAGGFAWHMVFPLGIEAGAPPRSDYAMGFVFGGLIGGLIAAIVMMFSPRTAPIAAPAYAVFEGLFLGALSGLVSMKYQGIVLQAGMLTVGVLAAMLMAYASGLVRATEKFRIGVMAATGAIALVYLATIVLSLFGVGIPYIHSSGPIGIGFSILVIVIASLNLVLDFDIIEKGASYGAPKYMEWYSAYGLLVTLVWLYIEFLRLLMKLRSSE